MAKTHANLKRVLEDIATKDLGRSPANRQMTRSGTAALDELTAGRKPKLTKTWCSRVQKAVRSGLDAPAGAAAVAEADSEADPALKATDEDKETLKAYIEKYSSLTKKHPSLSIRFEPKQNEEGEVVGNKGCGIHYDGARPLELHLGNYRTDGSREISQLTLEHLERTEKHRYVLKLPQ